MVSKVIYPLRRQKNTSKKELGVTDERAKKIVAKANTYKDNKIQKSEMDSLKELVREVKEEVCERFVKYDKDTSGRVTMDEAMAVLKAKFEGVNEESLKLMIKRYDADGTGSIEYREFIFFFFNVKCKREDLKQKWRELDKDLSGTISTYEASKMFEEECGIDEKMAKSLFEDFDMDKDGKLNREEFEKLFHSLFG